MLNQRSLGVPEDKINNDLISSSPISASPQTPTVGVSAGGLVGPQNQSGNVAAPNQGASVDDVPEEPVGTSPRNPMMGATYGGANVSPQRRFFNLTGRIDARARPAVVAGGLTGGSGFTPTAQWNAQFTPQIQIPAARRPSNGYSWEAGRATTQRPPVQNFEPFH